VRSAFVVNAACAAFLLFAPPATASSLQYSLIGEVDAVRSRGLGGTGAALEGDGALLWRNPLAAARQAGPTVTVSGQKGYTDDMTWLLSGVYSGAGPFAAAGGIAFYDAGIMTMTAADGTTRKVNAQQELLVVVNASVAPASWAACGATLKGMRSSLLGEYSSEAVAMDLGIGVNPLKPLSMAAEIRNAGRSKYRRDRVRLPTTAVAGASVATGKNSPTILADVGYRFDVREAEWSAGLEYVWLSTLSIRAGAGMPALRNSPVYSLGVGLAGGRMKLEYAIRLADEAGVPNDISLTIKL